MQLTVFSDDWGRHPSSCQHLVKQMLDRHAVLWVNTIGTRRPSLDAYSLSRAFEKVGGWLLDGAGDTDRALNPKVLRPLMWPSFGSRLARRLNSGLLSRCLAAHLEPGDCSVALTTLPITADLVGRLPVSRWVYYCVDDLSEWPGLDRPVLERMERELLDKADAVVTVSDNLASRVRALGREPLLLTHGVDLPFWRQAGRARVPSALATLAAPTIVFWGVVDRRLDLEAISALATALSEGSIVLVGPWNNPDPALRTLPRVISTGAVDYAELPGVAAAADVLIMPYRDTTVTRAMQPLKLKEYLATGKPVVCRDLPAVADWGDACDLYRTPAEFVARVLDNLGRAVPATHTRGRKRLAAESWAHKAAQLESVLSGAWCPS